MLDLLTVGPKFTRPACRAAAAAIDRYLLQTHARPQQQTHRPPLLLSTDGTDRQTDGRTLDRYMTFTAYYTDRVISLNINRFCVSSTSIYPQQSVARCAPTAKISGMFCCMPSNISVATLVGAKSEMPVRAIQDNYAAFQKRAPFHILNNSIKN